MLGYSDRINHALAFAAKHHDQQVRRGRRAPYFVQPANVAIVLTRYAQDDATVLAGILFDVADDWGREGASLDQFEQRIGEKFGADVLSLLLPIISRKSDDDGVEFAPGERREDVLQRLTKANEQSLWIWTAVQLHGAASLAADLRRTVDPSVVWSRAPGGREGCVAWHRRIVETLRSLGFGAPVFRELADAVSDLEHTAQREPSSA